MSRIKRFHGSSLPISAGSAISAAFIARLIKGCRGDAHAGYFIPEITKHYQRSNEHLAGRTPAGAVSRCGNRRAKCPS
jgi:ADP-ribosylglycohydrolase